MRWEWAWIEAAGACLTLWLSGIVFLIPVNKRRHVQVRAAAMLAVFAVCCAVMTSLQVWTDWFPLGVGFVFCSAFFLVCGDMPLMSALYCAVWAQVVQQLAIEALYVVYFYSAALLGWGPLAWAGAGALLFSAVYAFVGLTVARWMPSQGRYTVGPRQLTLALLFQAVFSVLCRLLTVDMMFISPVYPASILAAQFYCVSTLYLQYALFSKSAMKKELEILNALWHQQEEQYKLSRETIAIINRKCHDMKHQIAAIRAMPGAQAQEKYLREVEESVNIYDAMFQTGNEVLDTVLTEKSLYCGANGIRLSCVADGKELSFLDPVDIYTILGNALDNAIEGVQGFSDPEKRMIDVLICRERKFLVLQVVNPLEGELRLRDGLPESTKPRDGYHGFGLKSIRHTVEQYGGFATVSGEAGCFTLKILIPLKD